MAKNPLLVDLDSLATRARAMLSALAAPDVPEPRLGRLRPHDADFDLVFLPDVAAAARAGYGALWSKPPAWPARRQQTELRIYVALTEDFVANHPRSRPFPGGYKRIASHLRPGLGWLTWELVTPGESSGVAFDGLVAIGERWAWFPKPWRMLPAKISP